MAAAASTDDTPPPNSYADPYWSNLAGGAEQKLGLPAGLLVAALTKGEKSNADQVSEAGAKTPFQITPTTRNLVLKRDGIDAYLSPQNAAEVAGLVMQDGVNWAKTQTQDPSKIPALAAGYYHAGGDTSNWGPKTDAYIMRVTSGQKPIQQAALSNDFASWMAAHPATPPAAAPAPAVPTPSDAMVQGFGQFLANGGGKQPEPAQDQGPSMGQSIVDSNPILATGQFLASQAAGLGNAVVSGVRRVGAAAGTLAGGGSLGDALDNAGSMPEEAPLIPTPHAGPMAQAGNDAAAYAFGKLAQGTHAAGELVRQATPGMAALPGIGPIIQGLQANGVDPGAALGAATDAGGQVFGPALLGKVGGGVVSAVDAVRRTPTLTAESMALPEIDPARAVMADVPNDPATAAPPPVAPAAAEAPVAPAAPEASPTAPQAAGAPIPPVGDAVPAGSSIADVADAARKAADGKKEATQALVDIAAPNPKTVAAADRLGIGDYLQSDHVTTNDGYRQVLGVLKSDPTSELALAEKQGLGKVAERASNLIDEVGGTSDLSSLDAGIKKRMQDTHAQLKGQEDALYDQVRKDIPAASDAPAANTLEFIAQRAKDLGGEQNLTPMEKQVVAKLSPKGGAELPAGLDGLSDSAKAQVLEQLGGKAKQPTYALLDDVRKDVGAAASRAGPFSDADSGLAKKLYGLLSDDQGAAANAAGAGNLFARAKAATVVRKGMENDLASLFGKNLDGSLVGDVGQAMKAASNGDTSKLINVLRSTPDAMKGEVVASGLQTVFRNAATRGEINFTGYAKWYEGLLRNKQAHAAVMSNLPKAARKQLSDLYRVSKGISDSLNARIKTGLRSSVLEAMNAPESLATKMFQMAGHAGKGVVAAHFGGPAAGMGAALMSALSKNKGSAVKAIDTLLTSPEFVNLARQAGTPKQPAAVSAMANSAPFRRFMRSVDQQNATTQWRENWISSALAAPAASNHRN